MPDLTDAQLNQLINAIGLKEPKPTRELKPCGTTAAYERHRSRGETPCEACRKANTEAKRARNCTPTPERRKPIAHGTYAGYRQHAYRGETPCAECRQASSDYQKSKRSNPTPKPAKPIVHGTARGCQQHWNRGEEACEPCMEAYREVQNTQKRASRARNRVFLTEEEWQQRKAARTAGAS